MFIASNLAADIVLLHDTKALPATNAQGLQKRKTWQELLW